MIEVRGLKKTFDGFAALDGADLSVPRGAVYGLVGPNGAGKTTLLRHLTGVYRQDEGSVRFDGEEVWENAGVKARIASIPDDWFYFMQAGLRDMMRFYRGLYPKFDQEHFEKLREVFALDEKRPLRRMSKGQQKQAAFWLALCTMPDYLILDEPVDGLDPVMRRQVWSLILQDVAERYLRGIHGVECIVERRSGELEAAYVARGLEPDVGRFEQDRRPDTAVVVHQVGDRRFGDVSADAERTVAAYDRRGQHRVVLVGRAQAERVARSEASPARKGVIGASAAG